MVYFVRAEVCVCMCVTKEEEEKRTESLYEGALMRD